MKAGRGRVGVVAGVVGTLLCQQLYTTYLLSDSEYQQVLKIERNLAYRLPGYNFSGPEASVYEHANNIKVHLDGTWDCKDRAEVAKVTFRRLGYDTRLSAKIIFVYQGWLIAHEYVQVSKNGRFIKNVMKDNYKVIGVKKPKKRSKP